MKLHLREWDVIDREDAVTLLLEIWDEIHFYPCMGVILIILKKFTNNTHLFSNSVIMFFLNKDEPI